MARLTGVPPSTVRRWLAGGRTPVVRASGTPNESASFLDLVEVALVREVRMGSPVSYRQLTDQVHEAATVLGVSHPLARRGVRVEAVNDGGRAGLYLQIDGGEECALLHLGRGGQTAFHDMMLQRSRLIDFNEAGLACRWFPAGRSAGIVLDAERGFGAPTIEGSRLSVEVVVEAWRAEGQDAERVAELYELETRQVEAAIDFARTHRMAA